MNRITNVRDLTVIAMFAAFTAVLSYIYLPIPVSPVPVTGQTMGVMIAGGLLGPKRAFLSQVVYLLLGIVGIPVFAGGTAGIGALFGPNGGYLWTLPIAALLIGYLTESAEKRQGIFYWLNLIAPLFVGGMLLIYVGGVLQLSLVTQIPLTVAILEGAVPFIIGDLAKVVAGAFVIRSCHALSLEKRLSFSR